MHSTQLLVVLATVGVAAAYFSCSGPVPNTLRGTDVFDCSQVYTSTSGSFDHARPQHLGVILNASTSLTVIGYAYLKPVGTPFSVRQQIYDDEWALLTTSVCDTNFTGPIGTPNPTRTVASPAKMEKSSEKMQAQGAAGAVNAVSCYLNKPLTLNHGVYYLDSFVSYAGIGYSYMTTNTNTWWTSGTEDNIASPIVLSDAHATSNDYPAFAILSGFVPPPGSQ